MKYRSRFLLALVLSQTFFCEWIYADPNPSPMDAFQYLMDEKYEEAIITYEKLLTLSEDDPELLFNLGIAYYRTLRFSSAQNAFEKALKLKIEDPVFQSHSEYNIGSSLFKQAKLFLHEDRERALVYLKESIVTFENAVELQPDFEDARSNLSITRLLLSELEKDGINEDREGSEGSSENPPPESKPESDENNPLSGDSEGKQNNSPNNTPPQDSPPNPDKTKSSDQGGGTQGELMNINEAMMLLDSVEMDEKRITLSTLIEDKSVTAGEQPDW
jgi:tetratricopeptide (TPR) repeat protein